MAAELAQQDGAVRALQTELQQAQARRNALSKEIGRLRAQGADAASVMAEVGALKEQIQAGEQRVRELAGELEARLAEIPNVLDEDVPDGADESQNVLLRQLGRAAALRLRAARARRSRRPLGMDFGRAAKLSGARFVTLFGPLARLERALATFMLDVQTREHGYTEVAPPLLVREHVLFGTGQLPKFAADLFRTTSDLWLIPTAEVPLTNLVADEILDAEQLPLRYTAWTPCFRSEAGLPARTPRA